MMQDPWTLEAPRDPDELRELRSRTLAEAADLKAGGVLPAPLFTRIASEGFTCDLCERAPICDLAFDTYNTADDGSCLYDK